MILSEKFLQVFGLGNFKTKCKSALKLTKLRIEAIRRKRNSMQKFFKKDLADLLKSQPDIKSYQRAAGLYVELNMSSCYDCIYEYCGCILEHIKVMYKESECPKECRIAVASLIYAAARFADLPELRELRSLFIEKYGDVFEPFVSQEFALKLKSNPPTTKMKLQLLKDIAKEFSIVWDSTSLEKQLLDPAVPGQDQDHLGDLKPSNFIGNGCGLHRSIDEHVRENQMQGCVAEQNVVEADELTDHTYEKERRKESIGSESSSRNVKDNEDYIKQPFTKGTIPAPYVRRVKIDTDTAKTNKEKNDDDKGLVIGARPRPKSVRSRFPRKPLELAVLDHNIKELSSCEAGHQHSRKQQCSLQEDHCADQMDNDEKTVDNLLLQYSRKQPHTSFTQTADPKDPINEGNERTKSGSGLPSPSCRRMYFSPDLDSESTPVNTKQRHARAASFQPDGRLGLVHVHPKLPEYDELAERLKALKEAESLHRR
ncbi:hypothetical protein Dimus_004335 [Dionaea muscipula]